MRVSSRTLSNWYPRLATALDAGLGLERCLATMPGPPPSAVDGLAARLRAGEGLADALESAGTWLPVVDRRIIAAGAQSGRLPDALRRLATRHEAVARARTAMLLASAYPVALVHLGAFAFPIQKLVDGSGVAAYLAAVFVVLVPLWLAAVLALAAARRKLRPVLAVLDRLPLIGGFRRARALADLAFVLEALVVAGVRVDVAWLHAGIAAGDRRLELAAIAAADAVQRGEPVGPVLGARAEIPPLFTEYYRTGELSGRLDEALQAIQRQFSESAGHRLRAASIAYPAALLAVVAGWVIVRIVQFYAGYFAGLEALGE